MNGIILIPENFSELFESDWKNYPVPGMFSGLGHGVVEPVLINHHSLDILILSNPHTWAACIVQSKIERVGTVAVGKTHLNINK